MFITSSPTLSVNVSAMQNFTSSPIAVAQSSWHTAVFLEFGI